MPLSPNDFSARDLAGVYGAQITVIGVDGSHWYIAGPDIPQTQGVTLNPKLQGAIDAPVKTLWLPGAFGQEAQGIRWQRRDIVFAVQTFAEDYHSWMQVDSDWRYAWDYINETQIIYTTATGTRTINVRLLEEPKSYEGPGDAGKSPFLMCDSTIIMTVAAELPFYVGASKIYQQSTASSSATWTFPIVNESDVPTWAKWTLTAPALWTLPDYSWGSTEYANPSGDAFRTVTLPSLNAGEGVVVDSDPRNQTIIAANTDPVQSRWKGNDLLYPIAPGASGNVTVTVSGASGGAAMQLEVPQWFTRPWGRPRP